MQIQMERRWHAAVVCVTLLVLAGCAKFLAPETGALAREDARIAMDDSGVQNAEWRTADLQLVYSIDTSGDDLAFSGRLDFDRSLTDSYSLTKSFFLKISFIDERGQVLETVDITPLFSHNSMNDQTLNISKTFARPEGSSGIVFNYYGVFRGVGTSTGEEGNILYFPFD